MLSVIKQEIKSTHHHENEQITGIYANATFGNRLFQECSTGLPTEYITIEQTSSPKMLEAVKNWIVKTTKTE